MNTTLNLNPRSVISGNLNNRGGAELAGELEVKANQVFDEDRQWLIDNLTKLKDQLMREQDESWRIMQ